MKLPKFDTHEKKIIKNYFSKMRLKIPNFATFLIVDQYMTMPQEKVPKFKPDVKICQKENDNYQTFNLQKAWNQVTSRKFRYQHPELVKTLDHRLKNPGEAYTEENY